MTGTYKVTMRLDRHLEHSSEEKLLGGERIHWELDPGFALLDVISNPPGLMVTINGREVGPTPLRKHELQPRRVRGICAG